MVSVLGRVALGRLVSVEGGVCVGESGVCVGVVVVVSVLGRVVSV